MTNTDDRQHRSILQRIAHRMMLEGGLVPDLPIQVLAKLDGAHGPAIRTEESARDLRNLLWCSIDNDDSRDLDQLTVAEAMPAGASKILVAIADVDAVVKKHWALDDHARQDTTSVYTVTEIFPMLPEKLSTDLTSLNYESDRLATTIPRPVMTTRCLSISALPELSPFYGDSDYYQPGFPHQGHDRALRKPLKTNSTAVINELRPTPVVGQSHLGDPDHVGSRPNPL
jgi:hypothetical protein